MKLRTILAAAAAALSSVALSVGAQAADPIILKIHSFSSPQAPEAIHMVLPFIEKVNSQSQGRLKLEFYPSMQLGGKTSDLVHQLQDGVVDFIVMTPGVTPGRFSGVEGMDMPFTNVGTSEGQTPALLAFANKWLLDKDFKGIKIIHMHATDAAVFHTTKKPLKTMEDFKGMKIRAPGRYVGEVVKSFGGTPVGLPLGDVYEALERGQIDGMAMNWAIIPSYKFQEVTKFNLETPVYQNAIMVLMRQASFDALPADLKKIIDDNIGIEKSVEVAKKIDLMTVDAKKILRDNGNQLYSISAEERARWAEAAKPTYKIWINEMNRKGFNGQAMFDDILALTAKHGRK
jgi:TRAP-type C4-dicarboxylate transport system substrate-binding protein